MDDDSAGYDSTILDGDLSDCDYTDSYINCNSGWRQRWLCYREWYMVTVSLTKYDLFCRQREAKKYMFIFFSYVVFAMQYFLWKNLHTVYIWWVEYIYTKLCSQCSGTDMFFLKICYWHLQFLNHVIIL